MKRGTESMDTRLSLEPTGAQVGVGEVRRPGVDKGPGDLSVPHRRRPVLSPPSCYPAGPLTPSPRHTGPPPPPPPRALRHPEGRARRRERRKQGGVASPNGTQSKGRALP